jgi:hypothetical protein
LTLEVRFHAGRNHINRVLQTQWRSSADGPQKSSRKTSQEKKLPPEHRDLVSGLG